MNALVVYDSQYGNTERIAQAIADTLRAVGQARAVRVDSAHPVELQGVDILIVGCPTQGWNATPRCSPFSNASHLNGGAAWPSPASIPASGCPAG